MCQFSYAMGKAVGDPQQESKEAPDDKPKSLKHVRNNVTDNTTYSGCMRQ